MKKIDSNDIKRMFARGKVVEEDTGLLYDICDTVFYIHFMHKYDMREDLIQEGVLGLIRLVDEGNYDESKGDVLTFVYSRVRNYMGNYLYHENKEVSKSVEIEKIPKLDSSEVDSGWFGYVSEEMVQEIMVFIDKKLNELNIGGDLIYCVRVYFMDKLGVQYTTKSPGNFSLDFVEKYRYYVNLMEYGVFMKFINPNIFDNKVNDVLDVLESEGDIGFYMRMFLDSLSESQLRKLIYVYSSNEFKFPSKYKVLKVDNYLSIYKRIRHGKMPIGVAAKFFDKPISTVESIVKRYDIIFS